jgi:hypothetical protein
VPFHNVSDRDVLVHAHLAGVSTWALSSRVRHYVYPYHNGRNRQNDESVF